MSDDKIGSCVLTVLCEMVRQPNFTPHFLFCHTFLILQNKRQTGKEIHCDKATGRLD